MVLSATKPGMEVTVTDIIGGRGVRSRLYSMGFTPGTKLTVLKGEGGGPVMVAVRGSRVAIGRGMANKITVE
ncbi:MAG: FeoA domain-containing protein [Desulfatiglans sp.]|jgi:Fe2+ transport system protein FeoA|nr:FeoA domain-containing protein [Thermodesulfobacteriota bacterium]MEE4354624.1 FeoA domain-containing protein [Desulfatiglans sp.]